MSAPVPTYHAALCEAVAAGLDAGAAVRVRARGASMRPLLRDGEDLRIVPLQAGALRPGDIVLVRTPGGAALHRVIAVDAQASTLRTKGDGSREADGALALGAVVGRADAVFRRGGWVRLDTPGRRLLGRIVCTFLSPLPPLRAAARALLRARTALKHPTAGKSR